MTTSTTTGPDPTARSAGTDGPRIYVACLASYNAGDLHGVWIDADQHPDDVWTEIRQMLRASPHPNVEVECPECEALPYRPQSMADQGIEGSIECPVCKGRGKVPSAEEHAIHDHECFHGIEIGEYESIEKVCALAQCLADSDGEAFAAWYRNDHRNGDADDMMEAFREAYRGTYRSVEDYAEEMIGECYDLDKLLPEFLRYHIDWEGVARDLELGGDIWTTPGGDGVFVFDNH